MTRAPRTPWVSLRSGGVAPRSHAGRAGSRPCGTPPEDFAEVVLRMGRLPQHESGQPLLAAGADHQVGVGLVTRIEVLADEVDVHRLRDVLDRGALVGGVEEHGAHGVGDLLAAAVADGDVDQYPVDVRRGLLGLLQRGLHLGGQDVRRAHVVHAPAAVGREGAYDALDDAEQGDELFLGAVEVVRRQQPEGDDLDVGLRAPAEELLDLVGTGTVPWAAVLPAAFAQRRLPSMMTPMCLGTWSWSRWPSTLRV